MKAIDKTFTIQITEREADALTTFLNEEYRQRNIAYKETGNNYEMVSLARELRNSFGSLINRYFMGNDA